MCIEVKKKSACVCVCVCVCVVFVLIHCRIISLSYVQKVKTAINMF